MHINRTDDYHRRELETLGWELTVCNMLADEKSPCRRVLKNKCSFGEALFCHLGALLPLKKIKNILEVGGGYGNLMADFLRLKADIAPLMLDISPAMLARQKEALRGTGAKFINVDFFDFPDEKLRFFDLAIFNENLGDFPTVCDIPTSELRDGKALNGELLSQIKRDYRTYGFPAPEKDFFNYNIGTVRAIEKLCAAQVPYIYASEHSCEALPPEELAGFLNVSGGGNPYAIRLHGHVEYTIKFSHLEKVAQHFGYAVKRGCFADFLLIDFTDEVRFILTSRSTKDEHEAIRQFVEDVYTYEYLVMTLSTI